MTDWKKYICNGCDKKCLIMANVLETMDDRPSFCPYTLNGVKMNWEEVKQ